MVKVNDVVKIKAGRYRGLAGVVEEVAGDSVVVKVEGVRDGIGFTAEVRLTATAVEVRQ